MAKSFRRKVLPHSHFAHTIKDLDLQKDFLSSKSLNSTLDFTAMCLSSHFTAEEEKNQTHTKGFW